MTVKRVTILLFFLLMSLFLVSCDFFKSTTTTTSTTTSANTSTTSSLSSSSTTTTADSTIPVFLGVELIAPDVNATFWSDFSNFWKRLLPGNDSLNSSSDTSALQTILEEAYPVGDTVSFDCYSPMNTDLQLKITLSNPNEYEILSFTLNGVKYQSYQFAWGSDSEHLYLTVNSGSTPGGREYTIDQIKYVDGTEIKDVLIEGNQTVTLGVGYRSVTRTVTDSIDVTPTSISFHVQILDLESLFANSQTYVKAILYDGEQLLSETDLILGSNDVTISDLEIGKSYTAVVFTEYDMLDGNGNRLVILDSFTFDTEDPVIVSNLEVDQTTVSFTLEENDPLGIGTLVSVDLMQGETMIAQMTSFDTFSFGDLYSNYASSLIITYEYEQGGELRTWTKTTFFTTLAKLLPSVTFETSSMSQDFANLLFAMNDEDQTFVSYVIEISQNGHLVETYAIDGNNISISSLYSNTTYVCTMIVTYDLNDQTGSHSESFQTEFTTEQNTAPTLSLELISVDQTSAILSYLLTDVDLVVTNTHYLLLLNETEVDTVSSSENMIFPVSLYSNTQYCLRMVFQYDLNDQMGLHTAVVESYFTTAEKSSPAISLQDAIISASSISVPYDLTDEDNTVILKTFEVRDSENASLPWNDESNVLSFTSLMSNSDYTIVFSVTYNLNDQTGDHILSVEQTYKTLKTTPVVSISFSGLTQNQVDYEIILNDPDSAAIISRVYAVIITSNPTPYEQDNSITVEQSITELTGTLTNLDSNRIHTVYVEYTYQASEHSEPISLQYQKTFTTPKMPVIYGMDSSTPTTDNISVVVSEMNEDGALQTNKQFTLYNSDKSQIISTEFDIQPEMLWGWVMQYEYLYEGLLSNNDFVLVISYQADLSDGLGLREFTQEFSLHTLSKVIPTLSFAQFSPEQTTVSWILSEDDLDQLGHYTDVNLYRGSTLIASSSNVDVQIFEGLIANTKYTLTANYVYDAHDGVGEVSISLSNTFWTKPLPISISSISLDSSQTYSVDEEVIVNVSFTNPSFVQILSVDVNGETRTFENIITTMCTFNLGAYANAGSYSFVISKVTYQINGVIYEQTFSENNQLDFDVLGQMNLISASVETSVVYIENAIDGQNPGYVIIELDNPWNYSVYSMQVRWYTSYPYMMGLMTMEMVYEENYTYSSEEIIVIDQNHIKILWLGRINFDSGCLYDQMTIESITYGVNEEATLTKDNTGLSEQFFIFNSLTPRSVTTLLELQNMENGYIYVLVNDIDMNGVTWNPKTFSGVFDGNGHMIFDLTMTVNLVSTGTWIVDPSIPEPFAQSTEFYYGLFGRTQGVITNLTIANMNLSITYSQVPDLSVWDWLYVGLLAGNANETTIDNVSVEGQITLVATEDPVSIYVGGIAGMTTTIRDSSATVDMDVTSAYPAVIGGISGSAYLVEHCVGDVRIIGSIESGSIGGIAGYLHSGNQNTIMIEMNMTLSGWSSFVGAMAGTLSGGLHDNLVLSSTVTLSIPNYNNAAYSIGGAVGYSSSAIISHNIIQCDMSVFSASPIKFAPIAGNSTAPSAYYQSQIIGNILIGDMSATTYSTITTDAVSVMTGYVSISNNYVYSGGDLSFNGDTPSWASSFFANAISLNETSFYTSIGYSNEIWDFSLLNFDSTLPSIK